MVVWRWCCRFYGPFDFLGIVTAAAMGLQHALAMAGGLVSTAQGSGKLPCGTRVQLYIICY